MITADQAWLTTLKQLLKSQTLALLAIKGAISDTFVSHEVINHTLEMDMCYPHVTVKDRDLPTSFAAAEALMILSGSNDLDFLPQIRRTCEKWSEDKIFMRAAYGPKFVDQMPYVLKMFKHDINTRRAVISVWRESPEIGPDTTCLVTLQFIMRNGKLDCIANMRSSDAYLGLPNDIATFSYLSFAVQLHLNQYLKENIRIGRLYCNAGSRHIYAQHLQKVLQIVDKPITKKWIAHEFFTLKDFKEWLTLIAAQQ